MLTLNGTTEETASGAPDFCPGVATAANHTLTLDSVQETQPLTFRRFDQMAHAGYDLEFYSEISWRLYQNPCATTKAA